MKAVILVAGDGRRMNPLTQTRPKAMLPVAGRPIIEHLMGGMLAAGVSEFIFIIGPNGQSIKDYFGDGRSFGVNIKYILQERPLGTAAALSLAEGSTAGSFLVACGDGIVRHTDIARLLEPGGNQLGVRTSTRPERFGAIELDNARVAHIWEKSPNPPSNMVCTGVYLFTSEIFDALSATPISERGEYELPDVINIMIGRGIQVGHVCLDSWREISYPWDLLDASGEIVAGVGGLNEGVIEKGVTLEGAVQIGTGSRLRAGTYVSGPVIIGKNCDLGPNCYIRPATVIGDGCRIGSGVELKNSLIMSGTMISHLCYVGDSVVGSGCNLGAGTKVANLRLDESEIIVRGVTTGRNKFGVIMGDGVRTGINACLNPGTVIGSGAWIGPGVQARGEIASGAKLLHSL